MLWKISVVIIKVGASLLIAASPVRRLTFSSRNNTHIPEMSNPYYDQKKIVTKKLMILSLDRFWSFTHTLHKVRWFQTHEGHGTPQSFLVKTSFWRSYNTSTLYPNQKTWFPNLLTSRVNKRFFHEWILHNLHQKELVHPS
jgi:hypothetical protein